VISICPQAKFDAAKTHFYTNPCTTVMWRVEEAVAFTKSLVATPQTVAEFFAYAALALALIMTLRNIIFRA
jgi:hypothetical protein